ncbi:LOW QUALITY PROTEIN: probable RNA helicase armi [Drosophila tropicalis]|uniref:LOW QUALITY PROTEIN: probable RNA helicase armi n=1 Tax=Drosophila tropicalis TaxID=46794 RepID=UPI0035ABB88B
MFSLISHFIRGRDTQKPLIAEQLDLEDEFLDTQVLKEELKNSGTEYAKQITDPKLNEEDDWGLAIDSGKACLTRKGFITSIDEEGGIIDFKISFNKKLCGKTFDELYRGCKVQYLTYQSDPKDDAINLVKIERLYEGDWQETTAGDCGKKLEKAVESLKLEKPNYFKTQVRNRLGVVVQRFQSTIEVDTDCGLLTVELDNIEMTFSPKTGDCILIECKVQVDENYVDKQGELLEVLKIIPSRLDMNERCTVESVHNDVVELSDNAFILKEDIPSNEKLHLDDIVIVDLIESNRSNWSRRAIKLALAEKNFGITNTKFNYQKPNNIVSFSGPEYAIFTELWQKKNFIIMAHNKLNKVLQLRSIEINTDDASPQFTLLTPKGTVDIQAGEQISVVFEVHTQYHGEVKYFYTLNFDKCKVKRSFLIVVVETEEKARAAEKRLLIADYNKTTGRTTYQRNCSYANRVWEHKVDVVPGEYMHPKRRFVGLRLENYEVPDKLRRSYLEQSSRRERAQTITSDYPFLTDKLTIHNYAQRFKLFLHLEEIEMFIQFRNYDMERAHFQRDGEFLSLHVENLAERRPSLAIGDVVRANAIWDVKMDKSFEGIVTKVLFDRVLLKFNSHFHDNYNNADHRVEFYFSRYALRKQHYAIPQAISLFGENFLFPSKLTKRKYPQLDLTLNDNDDMYLYNSKLTWYNQNLNGIQKRAVFNILRGEADNMPYVIFGPPGTGKTVTVVETILQLLYNLPSARLLVGTPSNSAADLITKRLINSNVLAPGTFIRLVSQNIVEKDLIPPDLAEYCATLDIGTSGTCSDNMLTTASGLKMRCQMNFLGNHRVTISTCTTLGNFLQVGFKRGHFTHILIDEAGQCTESETIVPVVLLSKQPNQVILAGDPNQLQSIITNPVAKQLGFDISFLERVVKHNPYCKDLIRFPSSSGHNPCLLTKLLYNYRALPSIMNVYSRLFYENELIPMISDKDSPQAKLLTKLQPIFSNDLEMPPAHGVIFYGVIGENVQERDSPSWFNASEAQEIFLTTLSLYRRDISPDQIGIITPYTKQVKTIRNMFAGVEVSIPKIGSVEEFQGQERDIILVSTVRSCASMLPRDTRFNLGFVRCNKRMNVAISRARSLLVVVGNPHLLAVDDSWRRLIIYCAQNNAYFGCEIPEVVLASVNEEITESS